MDGVLYAHTAAQHARHHLLVAPNPQANRRMNPTIK